MTLKDYLKTHNVSRAAFADLVGTTYETVLRWCDGTRRPGWRYLPKILAATGGRVTAEDFFDKRPRPRKAA